MIESIGSVATQMQLQNSDASSLTSSNKLDFSNFISSNLSKIDSELQGADKSIRTLAASGDIPVHDVMIQIESARMNLMLATEVRNKVVEAYQELMRMQL